MSRVVVSSSPLALARLCPTGCATDTHLAKVAPQGHSVFSLGSGRGSEIPLP
jgi:hypothetical protein